MIFSNLSCRYSLGGVMVDRHWKRSLVFGHGWKFSWEETSWQLRYDDSYIILSELSGPSTLMHGEMFESGVPKTRGG